MVPQATEKTMFNEKAVWHYTSYLKEEKNMQLGILQKEQNFFIPLKSIYILLYLLEFRFLTENLWQSASPRYPTS